MIEISFSKNDVSVISSALLESFAGYAGGFLPNFLNAPSDKLEGLHDIVMSAFKKGETKLTLAQSDWRLVYESINATIYELGPGELQTITGHHLNEFLNTGRIIYAKVYDRPSEARW